VKEKRMKTLPLVSIILACLSMIGCNGCFGKFYSVHEEPEHLNVAFEDPNFSSLALVHYFKSADDSIAANYTILKCFEGLNLKENERVIHFRKKPNEYYWVSFDKRSCNIMAVLNSSIDSSGWIFYRKQISSVELNRIRKRFNEEVLTYVDSLNYINRDRR
jgi:hypothetical protein